MTGFRPGTLSSTMRQMVVSARLDVNGLQALNNAADRPHELGRQQFATSALVAPTPR